MATGSYRRGPEFKYYHVKDQRDKRRSRVLFGVQILLAVLLAFAVVFLFGHKTKISTNAMYPTLEEGDTVLINRLSCRIGSVKRGDIVAFFLDGDRDSQMYVSRVVGVPGDTLQITDGTLYVNGEETETAAGAQITVAGLAEEEITLGEDEYFVLGDDPDEIEDSRYVSIGTVSSDEIYGKVWFVLFPLTSIGLTE